MGGSSPGEEFVRGCLSVSSEFDNILLHAKPGLWIMGGSSSGWQGSSGQVVQGEGEFVRQF